MKLSSSLLQAIALGVSVSTTAALTSSCEKERISAKKERTTNMHPGTSDPQCPNDPCPACGMG